MARLHLRVEPEKADIRDILDRILEKGIVLNPRDRIVLGGVNLHTKGNHIVVARERRRKPFIIRGQS